MSYRMARRPQIPSALRARRLECGLTQAELAARAGVSRQLVAAVETGQNAPAVATALALARALGATVEELFSPVHGDITPALGGRLPDGTPVKVGRVDDRLVAGELADHGSAGATWASPDGVIAAGTLRLFAGAAPAGLVLAGCEPALGVAETMLQGLGPRRLLALSASTGRALHALERRRLHGAVVHGPEGALPAPPVAVRRLQLARWQVGLGVVPSARGATRESLLEGQMPIVQRDAVAASQQALMRARARIGIDTPLSGPRAGGHIEAARLAATLACAAVTTEAAARAFGLRFVALEQHTVQIWLADEWAPQPAVEALGGVLASAAFTDRVAPFGGYDLSGCGARVG
jgi:DNA-binding XRE family transcriptional regulator